MFSMRYSKALLTIALILCQFAGIAQQKGVLRGRALEKGTNEPLPNAAVSIVGTFYQTLTDFDGNFEIRDIKPGTYSVKFQFIGYQPILFNDIKIVSRKPTVLTAKLQEQSEMLNAVTVVGRKNQVDLEKASSAITLTGNEIGKLVAKGVEDVLAQQAGVQRTTDGLQIRGARVYETEYLIDGISAQDPLAGTGGGVSVSSSSVGSLNLMTGGASAEYGGGSAGIINTRIKEGGEKFSWSLNYQTDQMVDATSFNTDELEVTVSTPVPFTKKKLRLFTTARGQCKNIVGAELSWALNSNPDGSEGVTIVINTLKSTISVSSKYGDNGTALCVEAYYAFDGRGYKEASIALVSDPKFLQAYIENEHPFGICSTKIAA